MVIRNDPFAYPQSGSPAHGVPGKFPFNSSRSTQAKDNSVAIRPIVIHGNPVLHRPAAPVTEFNDGIGRAHV